MTINVSIDGPVDKETADKLYYCFLEVIIFEILKSKLDNS